MPMSSFPSARACTRMRAGRGTRRSPPRRIPASSSHSPPDPRPRLTGGIGPGTAAGRWGRSPTSRLGRTGGRRGGHRVVQPSWGCVGAGAYAAGTTGTGCGGLLLRQLNPSTVLRWPVQAGCKRRRLGCRFGIGSLLGRLSWCVPGVPRVSDFTGLQPGGRPKATSITMRWFSFSKQSRLVQCGGQAPACEQGLLLLLCDCAAAEAHSSLFVVLPTTTQPTHPTAICHPHNANARYS